MLHIALHTSWGIKLVVVSQYLEIRMPVPLLGTSSQIEAIETDPVKGGAASTIGRRMADQSPDADNVETEYFASCLIARSDTTTNVGGPEFGTPNADYKCRPKNRRRHSNSSSCCEWTSG